MALTACTACKTTPDSSNLAQTIVMMDTMVPIAVAVAVQHDPNTVPYFRQSADQLDHLADTGQLDPQGIIALIHAEGGPVEAEFAVLTGVALYNAFVAQEVNASEADKALLLHTAAKDIRLGLPPATPQSVRAMRARR